MAVKAILFLFTGVTVNSMNCTQNCVNSFQSKCFHHFLQKYMLAVLIQGKLQKEERKSWTTTCSQYFRWKKALLKYVSINLHKQTIDWLLCYWSMVTVTYFVYISALLSTRRTRCSSRTLWSAIPFLLKSLECCSLLFVSIMLLCAWSVLDVSLSHCC